MPLSPSQNAFLACFRECGNVSQAARSVPISRFTHYDWLETEEYRIAFSDAQEEAADRLEQEARRRAVHGTVNIKFTKQGIPVRDPRKADDDPDPWYYEHVYSDILLSRLLCAHRPEKFRTNISQEISGPGGGPIEQNHAVRQIAISNPAITEQLCQALEMAVSDQEET